MTLGLRTSLILGVLILVPAHAQEYVAGQSTCRTWTDLRQSGRYAVEWNWIVGYAEAVLVNDPALTQHGNQIAPPYIMQWFDTYCRNNPLQALRQAARAFQTDQRQRFKPPAAPQ
jgi:hypothetical protein